MQKTATALLLFPFFPLVTGDIGTDHLCNLFVFVPFTSNGSAATSFTGKDSNPGFAFMAAAILAMDHFNSRNASIIPDLASPAMKSCPIQFDMNRSQFF